MRDPHVEWLLYHIECAPTTSFRNPPPIQYDDPGFSLSVKDEKLRFTFKEHHASIPDAQASIAPFLRAWEIKIGLESGPGQIRFTYGSASVIDRNPPGPGETQVLGMTGLASGFATGRGTLHSERSLYPEPPRQFVVSPDVEILWQRYNIYVDKREPLSAMAFFCLTVLEHGGGRKNRGDVALKYKIDIGILNRLGDLTESRGDFLTARKMNPVRLVPYTPAEITWIETAVKAIIRRVAEIEGGSTVAEMKMSDLPPS
jgi:hypothetical protein